MPKAANAVGQIRKLDGEREPIGRQPADQLAHERFVLADQRALGATLLCLAEQIERRAAQELQFRDQSECRQHPRPVWLLDQVAVRVLLREERRREMEVELPIALELALQPSEEGRVSLQAGDFILVLIGHQLVQIARDGLCQRLLRGVAIECALRLAHFVDERPVPLRVGLVLIGREVGDALLDQCIDGLLRMQRDDGCAGGIAASALEHGRPLHAGEIVGGTPAPFERGDVLFDLHAVQLDGPGERAMRERQPTALPRIAEHERVRINRVAEQRNRETIRIDEIDLIAGRRAYVALGARARERPVGVLDEFGRRRFGAIDDNARVTMLHPRRALIACRDDRIAADHEIGFAHRDTRCMDVAGLFSNLHMAHDRAALLRKTRHVEHRHAFALKVGRHAEQRADRHDARAAHARDEHAVGPTDFG